jgi:hypothetical protein
MVPPPGRRGRHRAAQGRWVPSCRTGDRYQADRRNTQQRVPSEGSPTLAIMQIAPNTYACVEAASPRREARISSCATCTHLRSITGTGRFGATRGRCSILSPAPPRTRTRPSSHTRSPESARERIHKGLTRLRHGVGYDHGRSRCATGPGLFLTNSALRDCRDARRLRVCLGAVARLARAPRIAGCRPSRRRSCSSARRQPQRPDDRRGARSTSRRSRSRSRPDTPAPRRQAGVAARARLSRFLEHPALTAP